MFEDRHHELRHALVGDVCDMLRVMEEGRGVVIAAEQQDLAIELDEPLERRLVAERIVPRLPRDQMLGVLPPHDEARHVRIDP